MSSDGYQWSCGVRGSYRCPQNQSGKPPAKCPVCKGWVSSRLGRYGVFVWSADGRYPVSAARSGSLYLSKKTAERVADKLNERPRDHEGFVVRFIDARELETAS